MSSLDRLAHVVALYHLTGMCRPVSPTRTQRKQGLCHAGVPAWDTSFLKQLCLMCSSGGRFHELAMHDLAMRVKPSTPGKQGSRVDMC